MCSGGHLLWTAVAVLGLALIGAFAILTSDDAVILDTQHPAPRRGGVARSDRLRRRARRRRDRRARLGAIVRLKVAEQPATGSQAT